MVNKRIYLTSPHMSEEGYEMEYIKEAFDTNWIAPLGKNVDEFEHEIAQKVKVNDAVALTSGTAALHMALRASGVTPGDIVFCPSFTFSASANPIIYQGASPVFIDSDLKTWNMDPIVLGKAFMMYKPKAVLVVHLYGLAAQMDAIVDLCKKYHVTLIEDAAESLGTTYKGVHTGTMGDFGVYSFNGNKIITTSGGGMLVSNQKDLIDKVRYWATQSRDDAPYYQHSELGFNYKMSNIIAGIGRGQLKVLDRRIQKKKEIFQFYQNRLSDLEGLEMMPVHPDSDPNYWLSCILLNGKVSPTQIIKVLGENNIEARYTWKPMHMQPYFSEYEFVGEGICEEIFNRGVCLPSDTKLTLDDLDRIVELIRSVWKQ
ncbi:MAG TPA: aminotransferase DegT [Clostridiales bacterium]|nr:aminotransferase DegT [Clostridiales bacterium]